MIYNLMLAKYAVHPASQSCPMESRDPDARRGKKYACVALEGSVGLLSWVVYGGFIVCLLGEMTCMPF